MTPEAQRIAIAEACGWTHYHADLWVPPIVTGDPDFSELQCDAIPDYPTDLNAMHEAEKVLPSTERDKYWVYLSQIVNREHRMASTSWLCVNATAAQRAEAFLRTIGKWEEPCHHEELDMDGVCKSCGLGGAPSRW